MASMEDRIQQILGEKSRERQEAEESAAVAKQERVRHGAEFEKLARDVILPILDRAARKLRLGYPGTYAEYRRGGVFLHVVAQPEGPPLGLSKEPQYDADVRTLDITAEDTRDLQKVTEANVEQRVVEFTQHLPAPWAP